MLVTQTLQYIFSKAASLKKQWINLELSTK